MTGDEAAFPAPYQNGLTKRELFAAMAMQPILTGLISKANSESDLRKAIRDCPAACVSVADAFLKELEK